jgi:5S rRNA maturation endonuclease (ribonuclease M5)
MKFYSFDEIRAVGDCVAFARDVYGAKISGGRCAAVWRGGDNPDSVAIDKDRFFDHKLKRGGGIIELAAMKFDGDKQKAQLFLGEMYCLRPKMETVRQPVTHARYDRLIEEGYAEVGRYEYKDLDGTVVHFVARLEKKGSRKEFCQGTPEGWGGIADVTTILYNLAAVTASDWAIVVEGEKKCQMLIDLGLPATTCCGGASKWNDSYADALKGKSVAILPDNDTPGWEHSRIVAESLRNKAREIKVVQTSLAEKGDVADWLKDREDVPPEQRVEALIALIADAAPMDFGPKPVSEDKAVEEAKKANAIPFANFSTRKTDPEEDGPKRRRGRPSSEDCQIPRTLRDLVADCHRRFLGFPKKIGDYEIFDHDRDTGRIVMIHSPPQLFAWMALKGNTSVMWGQGAALTTKPEYFAGLQSSADRYESVSYVPDYPMRDDVYYAHPTLPTPCPSHSRFFDLVDRFVPATDADRTFLKAFFCAPSWYRPGIPKPSWVVDSEDGAGTGKSTIVEACALLYKGEPIRTNRQELTMGVQELIKRLVSASGRQSRIVLIDNVTGTFSCPELADLITANSVSGRSPYGHGEETRPNNIIFAITANTATVDNDLSDRSYFINVRRPQFTARWKEDLMRHVNLHRYEILADIFDLLKNNTMNISPRTRFPEFETEIMSAVCSTVEEYEAAITHLKAMRAQSNVEEDHARMFEDRLRDNMTLAGIHPEQHSVFLTTAVLELWLSDVYDRRVMSNGGVIQYVRNLSKMGIMKGIDSKIRRWPHNGTDRPSGVMWNHGATTTVRKVVLKGKKDVEVRLV